MTACHILFLTCAVGLLSGCYRYSTDGGSQQLLDPYENAPIAWHAPTAKNFLVDDGREYQAKLAGKSAQLILQQEKEQWVLLYDNEQITQVVAEGIENNFALSQAKSNVEAFKRRAEADSYIQYPRLGLQISGRRQKSAPAFNANTSHSLGLELSWEIDWLGKLNDIHRQSVLSYQSTQYQYEQARLNLCANLISAWFRLHNEQNVLAIDQEQLRVLRITEEVTEAAYRDGISSSADALTSRYQSENQTLRVRQQKIRLAEASRSLQLLLGRYPDGRLRVQNDIEIDTSFAIPSGIPSDILRNRPDLNSAWLEVLSADLGVAIAVKDQLPSITLTGSIGNNSSQLTQLFSSDLNLWSLALSVTQSIIGAGQKYAISQQRQALLEQTEQRWLQTTYQAFSQVESLLTEHASLQENVAIAQRALEYAKTADEIRFEQYSQGLIIYTRTMEARQRYLQAQTQWHNLNTQLHLNNVAIYQALGGFNPTPTLAETTEPSESDLNQLQADQQEAEAESPSLDPALPQEAEDESPSLDPALPQEAEDESPSLDPALPD